MRQVLENVEKKTGDVAKKRQGQIPVLKKMSEKKGIVLL